MLFVGLTRPASALNPDHKLTQYVHRIWQTQAGLPQTSISAVTQGRDGYLWLGTESGVVRFDGIRFTPVPELERASLADLWAHTFVEDSQGRMWIVTSDSGLVRVGKDGVKVFSARDGLPWGDVNCAFASQAGEVWVCTASGIARFTGDRFQMYNKGLHGRPVTACQTPDRVIWLAGEEWVASLNGSAFTQIPLHSIPQRSEVFSMVCRSDGVWVGTRRGLIRFGDRNEQRYSNENGLPDSIILSLATGSHGELWIGTQSGLTRRANGTFESFSYDEGLSQKDVFSIFEDREGSLWVATKHGLNQFFDGPATRFTRSEGLPSNDVGPVLEDRGGNLWVGFLSGGLARWNGRKFSVVPEMASRKVTASWRLLMDYGSVLMKG
jgi:ligand-binding sensor domain-containing protein